jgi:ATP synthase F0 subunit c
MGLGAVGAAVGEGYAARGAVEGIARQPAAASEILRTMLVGQAVAESASIFALVIAVLLLFNPWPGASAQIRAIALVSAGLCMGAGALGPGFGAGLSAATACLGTARQPRAAKQLTTTMLVGQAVAQTPSIFALLVAFLLLFRDYSGTTLTLPLAAATIGAGIATGFGAFGPGVGAGLAAASACDATARRPAQARQLVRVMLTGQAICQANSVYGLLVSLLLIFAV